MEIISNTAIIAVNQDSLGQPAYRIWKKPQDAGGDLQLWAGPLADGSVLLLSLRYSHPVLMDIPFAKVNRGRSSEYFS
jgi:alpha-galactosidase